VRYAWVSQILRRHLYLRSQNPFKGVDVGARIVTSGHGGIFPAGIPVGRVSAVSDDVVRVSLFADIGKTVFVRVLDRPQNENLRSLN